MLHLTSHQADLFAGFLLGHLNAAMLHYTLATLDCFGHPMLVLIGLLLGVGVVVTSSRGVCCVGFMTADHIFHALLRRY